MASHPRVDLPRWTNVADSEGHRRRLPSHGPHERHWFLGRFTAVALWWHRPSSDYPLHATPAHVNGKCGLDEQVAAVCPTVLPKGEALHPPSLPGHHLNRPLALGRFTWGTKTGVLVLAPRYPIGGVDGGYLVFEWTTDGADAAISLHA
jgi:hypothetical protein